MEHLRGNSPHHTTNTTAAATTIVELCLFDLGVHDFSQLIISVIQHGKTDEYACQMYMHIRPHKRPASNSFECHTIPESQANKPNPGIRSYSETYDHDLTSSVQGLHVLSLTRRNLVLHGSIACDLLPGRKDKTKDDSIYKHGGTRLRGMRVIIDLVSLR